jgi:hypothetical protein
VRSLRHTTTPRPVPPLPSESPLPLPLPPRKPSRTSSRLSPKSSLRSRTNGTTSSASESRRATVSSYPSTRPSSTDDSTHLPRPPRPMSRWKSKRQSLHLHRSRLRRSQRQRSRPRQRLRQLRQSPSQGRRARLLDLVRRRLSRVSWARAPRSARPRLDEVLRYSLDFRFHLYVYSFCSSRSREPLSYYSATNAGYCTKEAPRIPDALFAK